MDKEQIESQINDILEGEIQNNINEYLEQQHKQDEQLGIVGPDEGKELRVKVSQEEIDLSLIHISEPTRPY